MALIDKDQVKAEIERIMERAMNDVGRDVCQYILAFLDSLPEQPVTDCQDLDKHTIMEEIRKCGRNPNEFDVARHFYELGQQSRPKVDLENNGWIDCGKQMPKETKQWSDTLQGHREWTESDLVLAWDSMYGCRVDATKNGKWMSEQRGGFTGQILHGIIAWRPIPEFNEELLFNARKEE